MFAVTLRWFYVEMICCFQAFYSLLVVFYVHVLFLYPSQKSDQLLIPGLVYHVYGTFGLVVLQYYFNTSTEGFDRSITI